jgi:SAM-dependent methyltransferase
VFVPSRRTDPELMDQPGHSEAELEAALADIRAVNRRLRGSRVLLEAIDPYLDWVGAGESFEVLDCGSGGGDLLRDLVAHVKARDVHVRVVGVERDPVTAAIARRWTSDVPEIEIVQADAFKLPYPEGSFDVVTASLFMHHFEYQEVVVLLRRLLKLARKAVVVNDLRRHLVPWAFIALAARGGGASRMFRHDAPLSVLRGFTVEELEAAAEDAGAFGTAVVRRWPFRLVASIPALGRAVGPTP